MGIINLTPHPLNIVDTNGEIRNFPKPDAEVVLPRVAQTTVEAGQVDGITEYISSYGEPQDVPFNDGNVYVVSRLVIAACAEHGVDHSHLRSPGRLLRDDEGKIIGAEGLAR